MKNRRILGRGVLAVALALAAPAFCHAQDQGPARDSKNREIIFAIGKENKSDREFLNYGWKGTEEYVCRIGAGFSEDKFPAELHVPGAYESFGVVRLKIIFGLQKPFDRVILRLLRGGDETTIVKVDGTETYTVTKTMLGSAEGFRVGSYELDIGSLDVGEHTLEFSVAEDGKGNGAYQWDAIELLGT